MIHHKEVNVCSVNIGDKILVGGWTSVSVRNVGMNPKNVSLFVFDGVEMDELVYHRNDTVFVEKDLSEFGDKLIDEIRGTLPHVAFAADGRGNQQAARETVLAFVQEAADKMNLGSQHVEFLEIQLLEHFGL